MRKIFLIMAILGVTGPAMALTARSGTNADGRVAMGPRAAGTASTNQISAMANAQQSVSGATVDKSSVRVDADDVVAKNDGDTVPGGGDTDVDDGRDDLLAQIEHQKQACLNNNIGFGNTFVWASRYSNTLNYTSMVEDVNNPENNVCFVLVEVKSSDSRVDTSDVQAKYFPMGQDITCGSWTDEDMLRQRILDAKKSGRTWATVGGAVGGAGLGVGIMELFGNELIGGRVEGQASLSGDRQLLAQLRALKVQDPTEFNRFMTALAELKSACESYPAGQEKPAACKEYNFASLEQAKD